MTSLASRGRGAKIRPPRRGLNGSDMDFDATWSVLEGAFAEIHTKNASKLSFEELYRNAYKLVLRKKGSELYHRVAQFEEEWLASTVRPGIVKHLVPQLVLDTDLTALKDSPNQRALGEKFLRQLKQSWEDHQVCMGMLTDVLMYMDRVYCTDHRQPSIFSKSMSLFREQILRQPLRNSQFTLLQVLTHIILSQVQMDRNGEPIDRSLIKSNVYMLEGLYLTEHEIEDEKLYARSFEEAFLRTSADFYRAEGETLLKESDAGAYCKHAKRRIDEESDRCRSTLSESTAPKIQRVVEDELIRHKMKGLIEMESGVQHMVDNDKFNELHLVFDLEARVDPKKPELTKALQKIVFEMGAVINTAATTAAQAPAAAADEADGERAKAGQARQINQQTLAALKWVEDILALKDRFDKIWTTAFGSDQAISSALTRSMADNINSFGRSGEYISLFIDENMKKGIKDKTEAEIDQTLEKAITLLRYLQDKDVFETYYKKHLCKRLILNKSHSIEVEKQMIGRMKIEIGNAFTVKLEAMFKDMTLSGDLTNDYRKRVAGLGDLDPKRVDLGVNILTSMTWPLEAFKSSMSDDDGAESRVQIIFPPVIERIKTGFERFYADQYSGRKLTWQTSMGDADIKATFPRAHNGKPRTLEINCSTYAMLVLLLFNDLPDDESLSVEEIQVKTNIPMSALTRNLQSLAVAPKTRLLKKEPMGREVNAGDRFSFNNDFSTKFFKFKVGVVSSGNKVEGDRERKETEKKNNEDRAFQVEAAIVRIMKSRKDLTHANLLTETLSVLAASFKPDVNMIKKRIESLIEREYLERIEEAAMPSYRYLA